MIRLITIPHTGTRWMERELGRYRVPFVHEHMRPGRELVTDPGLPTLLLVRDPMLVALSKLNQGEDPELSEFPRLAKLWLDDGAYVFRVDCPGDRRWREASEFTHWLGLRPMLELDWTPEQPTADRTGLKARYEAGSMPDELWPWARMLNGWSDVLELLDAMGYDDLIWMA